MAVEAAGNPLEAAGMYTETVDTQVEAVGS